MSANIGPKFSGRRLVLNDSRSYLLQPELSPSPSQFQLSPTYSYCRDMPWSGNDYVGINGSWTGSSGGSLAPLLPAHNTVGNQSIGRKQAGVPGYQGYQGNGVGDVEQVHLEGLNQRPNTKMYDYADYGHQYEELPGGRKSMVKYPLDSGNETRSEYQSSGGATDFMSEAGEIPNISNGGGEKRKRVNPLYDAMTQSMPSIYSKTRGNQEDALRRQVRCLKCSLVIFVVISFAALVISVYAVISGAGASDNEDTTLTPQVQRLMEEYNRMDDLLSTFHTDNNTMKTLSELMTKVRQLETNMMAQIGQLQDQMNISEQNFQRNALDIISTHNNLSRVISQLNTTLQLQLYNLSKQPGPQGPQGVANFSLCEYYNVSNNAVASDTFPSYSPWAPTETDLVNNTVIFAACSVDGGTSFMLRTNVIERNKVQYSCKCSGKVEDKSRRICYVHYLKCPRES